MNTLSLHRPPTLPLSGSPCLQSPTCRPASPAHQPRGPGAEAVHEDPQRQGGGAQHKGANGEAQVEHLFLAVTAQPLAPLALSDVGGVLS